MYNVQMYSVRSNVPKECCTLLQCTVYMYMKTFDFTAHTTQLKSPIWNLLIISLKSHSTAPLPAAVVETSLLSLTTLVLNHNFKTSLSFHEPFESMMLSRARFEVGIIGKVIGLIVILNICISSFLHWNSSTSQTATLHEAISTSFPSSSSREMLKSFREIHTFIDTTPDCMLYNTIQFYPRSHVFCFAVTQGHRLECYNIDDKDNSVKLIQTIPSRYPQGVLMSSSGRGLIVFTWDDEDIAFHRAKTDENGKFANSFEIKPSVIVLFPKELKGFKVHDVALSPCEKYIIVAYGSQYIHPTAIAMLRMYNAFENNCTLELTSIVLPSNTDQKFAPHMVTIDPKIIGIPKGVDFAPDGKHIVVICSDSNYVTTYEVNFETEKIMRLPDDKKDQSDEYKKMMHKKSDKHPEGLMFLKGGKYLAIVAAFLNLITIHEYDAVANTYDLSNYLVLGGKPFNFPHSVGFSSDGLFGVVTVHGGVEFLNHPEAGFVCPDPSLDGFHVFRLEYMGGRHEEM